MDTHSFCSQLAAALRKDSSVRILASVIKVTNGRGNYAGIHWVTLTLAAPVGSIVAINVMPYRFDLDITSGNIHRFPGEIQLVGCARSANDDRLGPLADAVGGRVTLRSDRYFPALTTMRTKQKSQSWKECFGDDGRVSSSLLTSLDEFIEILRAAADSESPQEIKA